MASYLCRATTTKAAALHRGSAACAIKSFPVALQSLERENRRAIFPVAYTRQATAPAAVTAAGLTLEARPRSQLAAALPPPSAAVLLPLDVFLANSDGSAVAETGHRSGGAAAALATSDTTNDAESGGIPVAYD